MLSTGPPSSPLQSSRIAPGMPWEHAGTRHLERNSLPVGRPPAREASSSSTSHHTVTSPSNATAGAATAGSPYDRRQRLRYADYDPTSPPASPGLSATQPAPRFFNSESSHSSESIMDFAHMSDSARGSEDFTSYNQSNRSSGNELTRERDGVPTRKRSAQAAEYEADDSRFPVSEEEGNAKVSAMEESKEQVEMAPPETEAQRVQRIEERERRLRSLVQALCPLIDRFGRVLTDISPHMWEMGDLDSGAPASTAPAADNNPYHFETSLLNLLRDRYAELSYCGYCTVFLIFHFCVQNYVPTPQTSVPSTTESVSHPHRDADSHRRLCWQRGNGHLGPGIAGSTGSTHWEPGLPERPAWR